MRDRNCYGIAECANLIMIYIVCLTLMFFGQFWGRKEIIPLSAPILLAEIVFCYFARVKIVNFILFFVSHLVVAVGLFFLPSKLGKLELITFFVIFFILDIAFWMRRKGGSFTQIGIAFVILDALAYLHADVKKNELGMLLYFSLGLAFFLLYYVRLFFYNAHVLAKEGAEDDKMPFREMLLNGAKLSLPFVLFSILVMVFVKVDYFDKYALAVYEVLVGILGKVILAVLKFLNWLMALLTIKTDLQDTQLKEGIVSVETSPVLRILSVIIYIAAVGILLYVLVRVAISIMKLIPMKRKIKEQVIEKEDMVEIRRKIVRVEHTKSEKLSKIRRIYKKTVERAAKKGYAVNLSQTPRERAVDLEIKKGEKIGELSAKYEVSRYGSES